MRHAKHQELDADTRWHRAQRWDASESEQRAYARDFHQGVREVLAYNPAVKPCVQEVLARDEVHTVRELLAANPALVAAAAQVLARDSQESVRRSLAQNSVLELGPHFPVAFLEVSARGREVIESSTRGADPEALGALRPEWGGTLTELLEALEEFAPEEA
jgi:hypothetical protein